MDHTPPGMDSGLYYTPLRQMMGQTTLSSSRTDRHLRKQHPIPALQSSGNKFAGGRILGRMDKFLLIKTGLMSRQGQYQILRENCKLCMSWYLHFFSCDCGWDCDWRMGGGGGGGGRNFMQIFGKFGKILC